MALAPSHDSPDKRNDSGFSETLSSPESKITFHTDSTSPTTSTSPPSSSNQVPDHFRNILNMNRHFRNQYDSDSSSGSNSSTKRKRKIEYNNNRTNHDDLKRQKLNNNEDNEKFSCPICSRDDFTSSTVLEQHLEDNHPDFEVKCTFCNLTFKNHKSLNLHKYMIHNSDLLPKRSSITGFKDLTFVDFSSEKFPQIARIQCEKSPHKPISGQKYVCSTCNLAFPCSNSLQIHQENCSRNDSPTDLSQKSHEDLKRDNFFAHLDLQNKDKPNDLADIQSIINNTSSGTLLQHLRPKSLAELLPQEVTSAKELPEEESQDIFAAEFRKMKLRGEFPCRLCSAVFPNLRALKGHNRAHLTGNGSGPYRCNMCPHSSIDKAALIRHMRQHNGDRPYECSLCNYAFTTKANCERHLRNRHSKVTREEVKKSIIYHPSEDPTNEDNKKNLDDDFLKVAEHKVVENSKVVQSSKVSLETPFVPKETQFVPPEYEIDTPIDLSMDALDLSKKKSELSPPERKNTPPLPPQLILAQQLLKSPLVSQYYQNCAALFPIPQLNPFIFNPFLNPDVKLRMQLSGGSVINENLTPKIEEKTVEQVESVPKADTSVKMVIKNGVLMPKQKQRRYRTERPFSCDHCSARFTLRSNMERHIKQQHPNYYSQRQRGISTRKPTSTAVPKATYYDLNIPNFDAKTPDLNIISQQVKYAILAQHLRPKDEEEGPLIIDEDENEKSAKPVNLSRFERDMVPIVPKGTGSGPEVTGSKPEVTGSRPEVTGNRSEMAGSRLEVARSRPEVVQGRPEVEDLVPVEKLVDDACSKMTFGEFFRPDVEPEVEQEQEGSDEEGLVASGSTSEGNSSDEHKSENDTANLPKKKSAYSLAPNRVSCPYCSRKFPWTSSLRRHILTHTGQKPFKCTQCPLLFTTKSNCDRHLLRKHANIVQNVENKNYNMRNVPERPYKCTNCPSSTFSTLNNLNKHMICKHDLSSDEDVQPVLESVTSLEPMTSSELPFKCHLCEATFPERTECIEHLKINHSNEFELLLSKVSLEMDDMGPEDEEMSIKGKFPDYANRKVVCAFCLRRFWSAEDLRRHMRTHTGQRPFICDVCDRRFTLKHSMLRHRKKHNEFNNNNNDNQNNNDKGRSDSDCNESDLIGNLLGIRDSSIIEQVLDSSASDAAKLLGVNK